MSNTLFKTLDRLVKVITFALFAVGGSGFAAFVVEFIYSGGGDKSLKSALAFLMLVVAAVTIKYILKPWRESNRA